MASPTSTRIYEQIENTADVYPPSVYDLLLTCQKTALLTEDDSVANEFIPLTTVPLRSSRDAQLFIIGLIPPSANVSGFVLDRSATLASVLGAPDSDQTTSKPDTNIDQTMADLQATLQGGGTGTGDPLYLVPGYDIPKVDAQFNPGVKYGSAAVTEPDPTIIQLKPMEVYQAIYDAYTKQYGHPPTVTECLIYTTQSLRETGGRWPNNNPGFIRGKGSPNEPGEGKFFEKSDQSYYGSFSSTAAGASSFVRTVTKTSNARTAAQQGNVLGYFIALAQQGYYSDSVDSYYGNSRKIVSGMAAAIEKSGGPGFGSIDLPPAPNTCAFKEKGTKYRERIGYTVNGKNTNRKSLDAISQRFKAGSPYGDACAFLPPGAGAAPPTDWSKSGSQNAKQSQKGKDAKSGTQNLNDTALGQALMEKQKATIKALQQAIDNMAKTPPLRLLVNPTSFKINTEKVIADGAWTRNGPIQEHWGEQHDKISASGKLAAFYALDMGNPGGLGAIGSGPGLTRTARNYSASFQNFLSLFMIYKSNGAVWLDDLNDKTGSRPNNLALMGSVYIYYDHTLYIGSFRSLNTRQTDTAPYTMEYDFEFVVRASFLLDFQNDPKLTYGAPELFTSGSVPTQTSTAVASRSSNAGTESAVMSAEEALAIEKKLEQIWQDRDEAAKRTADIRAMDPTTREPWQDSKPNSLKDDAKALFPGDKKTKPNTGSTTSGVNNFLKKGK